MTSQGPNSPASGTNDAAVGTKAWPFPGNLVTAGQASISLNAGQQSNYIKGLDFGFSIPSSTPIEGIEVILPSVEELDFFGTFTDIVAKLVVGGSVSGTNKAIGSPIVATSNLTYGGPSDTWGLSLTDSDVNASDFGFVWSIQKAIASDDVFLNGMTIVVYYAGGAAFQTAWARNSNTVIGSGGTA